MKNKFLQAVFSVIIAIIFFVIYIEFSSPEFNIFFISFFYIHPLILILILSFISVLLSLRTFNDINNRTNFLKSFLLILISLVIFLSILIIIILGKLLT